MNRNDWEKQVYASDLNTTARAVALVVGSFGNWTEERTVWPSTKAIADMAGMTRDTAQKYMDAFVEQGWLELVKVRTKNVKEYRLTTPSVAESFGILAKVKRGQGFRQLPNGADSVAESSGSQLPNGEVVVAESFDTNLKEPTSKNLLEEPTTTTPVSDEPVAVASSLNPKLEESQETATSLNLEEADGSKSDAEAAQAEYQKHYLRLHPDERRFFDKADCSEEQRRKAVVIYRTGSLHKGGWYANAEAALQMVGVEVEEW